MGIGMATRDGWVGAGPRMAIGTGLAGACGPTPVLPDAVAIHVRAGPAPRRGTGARGPDSGEA